MCTMYNVVLIWVRVQVFMYTSGMNNGIKVQVNVQVEVWNCDPLYDDECLDMIHEDDDAMMHVSHTLMMQYMMLMHFYTLWCIPYDDNAIWR